MHISAFTKITLPNTRSPKTGPRLIFLKLPGLQDAVVGMEKYPTSKLGTARSVGTVVQPVAFPRIFIT